MNLTSGHYDAAATLFREYCLDSGRSVAQWGFVAVCDSTVPDRDRPKSQAVERVTGPSTSGSGNQARARRGQTV